jgi:hypothetical protein
MTTVHGSPEEGRLTTPIDFRRTLYLQAEIEALFRELLRQGCGVASSSLACPEFVESRQRLLILSVGAYILKREIETKNQRFHLGVNNHFCFLRV